MDRGPVLGDANKKHVPPKQSGGAFSCNVAIPKSLAQLRSYAHNFEHMHSSAGRSISRK